jgi:drug/metabolite transporter (DMT)-like permease
VNPPLEPSASARLATAPAARAGALIGRYSPIFVALAAALWVTDAYFRPALTQQLSAPQIVFAEDLLITVCFVPFVGRVRAELRRLPLRTWLSLGMVALGAQAFATVLFTRALGYAFPAHAAPDLNVENEVYLLYLLQPLFGVGLARVVLKERRRPLFWPLAAAALVGVYLIVFPEDPLSPFSKVQHGQLLAALMVLGAVFLWASGTVFGRYSLANVSFVTTAAMRFTLALPALFVLVIIDGGFGAFGRYSVHQIPSLVGIALVPGLLAMLLYYRALSSTPASLATVAELAYPCSLFLVFSLPTPVGLGVPLHAMEIVGATLLVIAVTTLSLLKGRPVVAAPRRAEVALAAEGGT